MDDKWLSLLSNYNHLQVVLETNQYTEKFGLSLTKEDTELLLKERKNSLKEQERVEFGGGILPKLIHTFCDSPYIYQDNYVDTIGRLQDIFYLYKNESLDEVTDDELLEYMKWQFDGTCQGSLDHLEDTSLEKFARSFRMGGDFMDLDDEEEDWDEE
jgi:hypothetical protein